jgi:phospholipid/cholesterol/gamma-HCH transport system substrate-binding protein
VEVVIKIALEGDVKNAIVTQLRAAGITGIVFVELDQRKPDEPVFLPPKEMKTDYPVIPSKPSQTKQMLSGIDQLMQHIAEVDFKGISDQVKQTTRAMETFVSGPEMNKILRNLDSTTAILGSSLRQIDGILAEGGVQGIIDETKQGLAETRRGIAETRELVATLKEAIVNVKTGELSERAAALTDKADRFVDGLDRRTREMASEIESTTDDIRQAVEHLRALLDRLQQNPSDLIFSKPTEDEGETGER